jgi:hypothetical protein
MSANSSSRDGSLKEQVKPIEQHGFTIVDFTHDKMVLRIFKWDAKTQPVEAIDGLAPVPYSKGHD